MLSAGDITPEDKDYYLIQIITVSFVNSVGKRKT